MPKDKNINTLIREHRTIFLIIAIGLFLLELEIFAIASLKSGRKSTLRFVDAGGSIVHETDGKSLSDFNKVHFEKTFGPLEHYEVRLMTSEAPFPFRAWFAAAVGLPMGVILLFAFFIKAYASLLYGEGKKPEDETTTLSGYESRMEKILAAVSRFNIFTIGFLVFLCVFAYWVVPNLIVYLGKVGVDAVSRYKWFFLSAGGLFLGLAVWIIYLKYLLAGRTIDRQAEIEKHRLQLEHDRRNTDPARLEYQGEEDQDDPPLLQQ